MAEPTNDPVQGSSYDNSKGALQNLHDAIGSFLGLGKATPAHQGKSIDDTVNEAVNDANKAPRND